MRVIITDTVQYEYEAESEEDAVDLHLNNPRMDDNFVAVIDRTSEIVESGD